MADGGTTSSGTRKKKLTKGAIARYYSASDDESPTLHGTMCDRLALLTHRSERCRVCRGTPGVRELDAEELASRANRIREADARITVLQAERGKTDHEERERLREVDRARAAKARLLEQLGEESTCKACRGTGFTTPTRSHRSRRKPDMFMTQRCGKCWGCGEPVGEVIEVQSCRGDRRIFRFARLLPTDKTAERQDRCERCGGEAFTIPVTAKETGSSKGLDTPAGGGASTRGEPGGPAYAATEVAAALPDEDVLERGRVEAALEQLRAVDPVLAQAVAVLNSPEGDLWATHRWGRSYVLWPLTTAGALLAREAADRSSRGAGHLVSALVLITAEREAELAATKPNTRRRDLIGQAHRQACRLMLRAQEALRGLEAA